MRAVVLSGEGRAFCAGLDMGNFGRMAEGPRQGASAERPVAGSDEGLGARSHGVANRAQYACWVWRELPVPVIAAVHGVAFGGGFQVALGARHALRRAGHPAGGDGDQVGPGAGHGRHPADAPPRPRGHRPRTDLHRPHLLRRGGVPVGFATRVCADPRAEALATAREIAAKSPDAIRAAKRILNDAVLVDPKTGLTQESVEQGRLIGTPNQVEAVMSNLQKRAAVYADPA